MCSHALPYTATDVSDKSWSVFRKRFILNKQETQTEEPPYKKSKPDKTTTSGSNYAYDLYLEKIKNSTVICNSTKYWCLIFDNVIVNLIKSSNTCAIERSQQQNDYIKIMNGAIMFQSLVVKYPNIIQRVTDMLSDIYMQTALEVDTKRIKKYIDITEKMYRNDTKCILTTSSGFKLIFSVPKKTTV